jgi:hypothetical protein
MPARCATSSASHTSIPTFKVSFNWRRLFFQDGAGHADLTLAVKGALAGGHFVKYPAECKHIRTRVRILALNLFRRHVLNSADHLPRAGYQPTSAHAACIRACGQYLSGEKSG